MTDAARLSWDRPSIESVTLELVGGSYIELRWEPDYDDEGDELDTGEWWSEAFNDYGGAEDDRPAEEWELRAAGLWREAQVAEPLTAANWEGDGA